MVVMRRGVNRRWVAAGAAALLAFAPPAGAHSLEDVEASLQERERYAQFVDRPAPGFTLTGVDGRSVSLADLRGRTVVLNFLYTRCTEACPLHMNLIAQLQDMVGERGLTGDVQFLTIATDTEDVAATRENMRAYGENFQIDPANWRFLFRAESEPVDRTMRLAEDYGLRFTVASEDVQIHGVVTHVIDPEGRLRARFHGLKFQPGHLVDYLEAVARGPDTASEGFWERLQHRFSELLGGD